MADHKIKILIIDDLIATGGTAEAAAKLVEISNGKVAAFIFVINLFDLGGSDNLIKNTSIRNTHHSNLVPTKHPWESFSQCKSNKKQFKHRKYKLRTDYCQY